MTAEQVAKKLTPAQHRELGKAIKQDPTGTLNRMRGGRTRPQPVDCDRRSGGSLVVAQCLDHASGWDGMFTVTDFGRQVWAIVNRENER